MRLGRLLSVGAVTPPMPFFRFLDLLEGSQLVSELAAGFFNSAYDVICRYFEFTEVRLHYLKWVGEAMDNPESNGTGVLVYDLLLSCPINSFTKSLELRKDRIGAGRPHEGLRMQVVVGDELFDLAHQIGNGLKGVPANSALCNQSEPPLDLVEPGGVGWDQV